jgi:hypothetical protein
MSDFFVRAENPKYSAVAAKHHGSKLLANTANPYTFGGSAPNAAQSSLLGP